MNDQQIVEYLRSRGRAEPPVDFTRSVMAAVDAAPAGRSRFSAYLPAFVAVGAAAVVAVLALLLGPGRDVGPAPNPSAAPSATAEAATLDDLRVALALSVDVLRAAPGVEGRQQAEIDGTIGTATWFRWRPNGDQVVVTRWDVDVTETGWWMEPDGVPPATGQRIYTDIQANVGDEFFFTNEGGDWQVAARDDGILAIGPGILDASIVPWDPLMGLDPSFPDASEAEARVEREERSDGGVEWRLDSELVGEPAVQRWTIGPGGELRSWTMEREDRSVDPDGYFIDNATLAWLHYTITDGDPIEPPDVDAVPDAAAVGAPADLPLQPPPPASLDDIEQVAELEAAVTAAVDQLAAGAGVQGSQTYSVEGYLASATWFDWRPNGDQVVVVRDDTDVSARWWADPDGQPLSVGERIDTTISVIADGHYYIGREGGWIAPLDLPRGPLGWAVGMLSGEIPAIGGLAPNADVVVSHDELQDGGETWVLEVDHDGETAVVDWRIDAEGRLASYAAEGDGATMPSVDLGTASTRTVIEFTPLDDPEPIPTPDVDAAPDPAAFGLPSDFPLEPG